MSELTPYVRDSIQCNYCTEQAVYYCPYCKAQDKSVNVCTEHALIQKGLPRCPVCKEGKLYRIEPRFTGSYEPMKKKVAGQQVKIWVKPKTLGKNEEFDRISRDEM